MNDLDQAYDSNDVTITTGYGRQLVVPKDDRLLTMRLRAGRYQKRNLVLLRRLVPKAECIIDVGMHIGMNLIEYGTWAKQVIGFEPSPENYRRALFNILMARKATNVQSMWPNSPTQLTAEVITHMIALGANREVRKLCQYKSSMQDHLATTFSGAGKSRPKVNAVVDKLDNFTVGRDVSAVKIDVEGGELEVLRGAEETIARCRPVFQIEMIEGQIRRFGSTCNDLFAWMTDHNYRMVLADGFFTPADHGFEYAWKMSDRYFLPREKTFN